MKDALVVTCVVAALAGGVGGLLWWSRRRREEAALRREAEAAEEARRRAREAHEQEVSRLREAIRAGVCPGCGASPIDATEAFQHTVSFAGGGGGSVYLLQLRCQSCGRVEGALDLR